MIHVYIYIYIETKMRLLICTTQCSSIAYFPRLRSCIQVHQPHRSSLRYEASEVLKPAVDALNQTLSDALRFPGATDLPESTFE